MDPYRVTLRFADGRFMVITLDVDEEQRRSLSPVIYLGDKEGEEVLALLKAWFPASFSTPFFQQQAGMQAKGGW